MARPVRPLTWRRALTAAWRARGDLQRAQRHACQSMPNVCLKALAESADALMTSSAGGSVIRL